MRKQHCQTVFLPVQNTERMMTERLPYLSMEMGVEPKNQSFWEQISDPAVKGQVPWDQSAKCLPSSILQRGICFQNDP